MDNGEIKNIWILADIVYAEPSDEKLKKEANEVAEIIRAILLKSKGIPEEIKIDNYKATRYNYNTTVIARYILDKDGTDIAYISYLNF